MLERILASVTGRRRPNGGDLAGGLPFEQLYPPHRPTGLDLPRYAPTLAIAASTSSVVLAAPNPARRSLVIVNDSPSATLYVTFGPVASLSSFAGEVGPGASFVIQEPGVYYGVVAGVWTSPPVGAARITETT
jgi:hypothetical protein